MGNDDDDDDGGGGGFNEKELSSATNTFLWRRYMQLTCKSVLALLTLRGNVISTEVVFV